LGLFLKELVHTLHSPDGKHKIVVDNYVRKGLALYLEGWLNFSGDVAQ
jgi:predicted membrane-bound spermidine synthase